MQAMVLRILSIVSLRQCDNDKNNQHYNTVNSNHNDWAVLLYSLCLHRWWLEDSLRELVLQRLPSMSPYNDLNHNHLLIEDNHKLIEDNHNHNHDHGPEHVDVVREHTNTQTIDVVP